LNNVTVESIQNSEQVLVSWSF